MSTAALVAFNLLLNGIGSFAIAWLLARAAVRLFRPAPGGAHLALLALPFLKVAFDLSRGVPGGSFLWLRARGVPQDLGSFQVGFGVSSWFVPKVHLALGARSAGIEYSQSVPDLLAAFLVKRVSPWVVPAIAALLLSVAAVRLAARAVAWVRAARERREAGRRASLCGRRRAGRRAVTLVVSPDVDGSPFTGGILRPYICFPARLWAALSPGERRAAIEHELAHAAQHHVLLTTLAGIVRDLFWFVPFIGAAERRLREACELAADARAVQRGTPPELLASALVRAREVMPPRAPARVATLAAGETSLLTRIDRLLDPPAPPRLGFQHRVPRVVLTLWLAAAVLTAVVLGNH